MDKSEIQLMSNDIDFVLSHDYVKEVMEEYRKNMRFLEGSLPDFGLHKCLATAIAVALCVERSIDPKELKL